MRGSVWRACVVVAIGAGAVGCQHTCPRKATLRGAPPPGGRSQWCERGQTALQSLPIPGRTFGSALEYQSTSMPGMTPDSNRRSDGESRERLLDGPMTEWHESGRVKSHGRFIVKAGRSVPHGVWSFWYSSGRPRSVGRYRHGVPVGCVGQWDEDGELVTYAVAGDQLVPTSCEVERDAEAQQLAETYATGTRRDNPSEGPAAVVLGFGSRMSPSAVSFSPEAIRPIDAQLGASFLVTARHRWRWLSLGLSYGHFWTADNRASSSDVGLVAGLWRFLLSDLMAFEIEAEWGARFYRVKPVLTTGQGADSLGLRTWYGGLRGGVEFVVTPHLQIHVGVFAQQDLGGTVVREQRFYGENRAPIQREVEWELDNAVYGSLLELRIGIR